MDIQNGGGFMTEGARILVVDDAEVNHLIFRSLLKGHGLAVDTALSGEECLGMIKKRAYDVIFMDYMMPGTDGIETFDRMKELADEHNINTPVVMLTADDIDEIKEKYSRSCFAGYLSKPIDKDKLTEMLLDLLPEEKISCRGQGADAGESADKGRFRALEAAFPDADIKKGLAYCSGSEDFYAELLRDLAEPSKKAELQAAYSEKNWKLYEVKIHAAKGAARTLGLTGLAAVSEGLQKAAEAEDTDYIEANHGKAMSMLDTLAECAEKL